MPTDIAKLSIQVGIDASSVAADMDRAAAVANARATRLVSGLNRTTQLAMGGKVTSLFAETRMTTAAANAALSPERQRLKDDVAHRKALADAQAELNRHEEPAQRRKDQEEARNRLGLGPDRPTESKGLFAGLNDAAEKLGGRRAIRVIEAGFEGATKLTSGFLGSMVNNTHQSGTEILESMTSMAAGVGSVLGGPMLGHAIGAVGQIVGAVGKEIDGLLNYSYNQAKQTFDAIAAGGTTAAQAVDANRVNILKDIGKRQEEMRTSGNGVVLNEDQVRQEVEKAEKQLRGMVENPHNRFINVELRTALVRAQMNELTRDLNRRAATGGLNAADAQQAELAQRLADEANISVRAAQDRLAPRAQRLVWAQQAAAIGDASTALRQQNSELDNQVRTAGMAEDAARRYAMVLNLQREYGIGAAEAQARLGAQLQQNATLQAAADLAALARQARNARLQGTISVANFVGFERTVQGSRGQFGEDTTTEESLARQQALAQREGERAEVEQRDRDAAEMQRQQRLLPLYEQRQRQQDRLNAARLANDGGEVGQGVVAVEQQRLDAIRAQIAAEQQALGVRAQGINQARQAFDAEQARLRAQDEQLRNLELQRAARQQEFQMMMQLRTPLEQYTQQLNDIEIMRQRGAFQGPRGLETMTRAIAAAQDRAEQAAGGPIDRSAAALGFGTTGAISAINRYRASQSEQESPMGRLLRVQEQLRQMQADAQRMQREQLQAQRQLNTNVAAGYVLAALNLAGR